MIQITALISVAILLFSFIFGILFYYFISQNDKVTKKKMIEEVMSLTINFIIFIWVGKIVVHFPKFIKDPLAILAYPSNAKSFYAATLLIIINIVYLKVKKQKMLSEIFNAFVPIFLASSFLYEFFQIIIEDRLTNVSYLAFIFLLLVLYVAMHGKVRMSLLTMFMTYAWLIGQIVLIMMMNITFFDYRISFIYFVVLLIIFSITSVYYMKKKV